MALMIQERKWPFKGKPVTNFYVQTWLTMSAMVLAVVACVLWPPLVLVGIAYLFYLCLRSIYRDIRKEWRT